MDLNWRNYMKSTAIVWVPAGWRYHRSYLHYVTPRNWLFESKSYYQEVEALKCSLFKLFLQINLAVLLGLSPYPCPYQCSSKQQLQDFVSNLWLSPISLWKISLSQSSGYWLQCNVPLWACCYTFRPWKLHTLLGWPALFAVKMYSLQWNYPAGLSKVCNWKLNYLLKAVWIEILIWNETTVSNVEVPGQTTFLRKMTNFFFSFKAYIFFSSFHCKRDHLVQILLLIVALRFYLSFFLWKSSALHLNYLLQAFMQEA